MLLLVALCTFLASSTAFNDTVSLVDLDKRLTNLLMNPEAGKGDVLISDGYFLYTNLDDVLDMIEANDPKGKKIYEEIQKEGGIRFIKADYDPDKVRDTFQYNPDEYEQLIARLGGIENTWKGIEVLLNVTKVEAVHATANPQTQW